MFRTIRQPSRSAAPVGAFAVFAAAIGVCELATSAFAQEAVPISASTVPTTPITQSDGEGGVASLENLAIGANTQDGAPRCTSSML